MPSATTDVPRLPFANLFAPALLAGRGVDGDEDARFATRVDDAIADRGIRRPALIGDLVPPPFRPGGGVDADDLSIDVAGDQQAVRDDRLAADG